MSDQPVLLDDGRIECQECGNVYTIQGIGNHWSACSYPELPDIWKERILGFLLGDGSMSLSSKYPQIQVAMINKPFIDWLDSATGWLTTGVSVHRTPEQAVESAERCEHPYSSGDVSQYHTSYRVCFRTMPQFNQWKEWYCETEDRLPESIELTSEVVKMWYVSDGHMNYSKHDGIGWGSARIVMRESHDIVERIANLFERDVGLKPTVTRHGSTNWGVDFDREQTRLLIEFMGDAPPGFEYKFCWDDPSKYREWYESMLSASDGYDVWPPSSLNT